MRRASALVLSGMLTVAAAACGSSPSSPSASSLSVSGNWSGKFEYQTAGVTVSDDVTLTLTQPSTTASGNWSASAGLTSGTVSFAASATVAGTFTITQSNIGGNACSGSSTIAGTASATDLVFTVANLAQTPNCPWATGMKFTLKK